MAQLFKSSGDDAAAAEAAYQLVRKANSSRATSSDANYKRQAIQILADLGRLEKIIQQAEKRAESAPNSTLLQTELADLYSAAGRSEDAKKMIDRLAKLKPHDPDMLLRAAQQLAAAKNHEAAIDQFLRAFDKQPNLMNRHFYDFTRSVRACKKYDHVYRELAKWDVKKNSIVSARRVAEPTA